MITDQEATAEELDDAPEPDLSPLTGPVTSDDITASADDHGRAAAMAMAQAAHDRTEAEEIFAAAQERIAQIAAEAEARMRPLADSAAASEKAAGQLGERARILRSGAAAAAQAEQEQARADALEAERDKLAERAADLAARLAGLSAERAALDGDLSGARDRGDLDAMTSLRGRIAALDDLAASLGAQRASALARVDAIGNGEQSPIWPQKPWAEARRIAGMHSTSARRALNHAFPGRSEAAEDRKRAEFLESLTPRPYDGPEPPRTFVLT